MRYLNVIHVPFVRTPDPQRVLADDLWLTDIRAQVNAMGNLAQLVIASPLIDAPRERSLNYVPIAPAEEKFEHFPLPFFISMKEYVRQRRAVRRALKSAVESCDVVHCGNAGWPIPIGEIAWEFAGKLGKKRIWIFDGADPFPRLELNASQERNPLKRAGKRWVLKQSLAFARQAVQDADIVYAHNDAVAERFKDVWNDRCYRFDRTFVTDEMLAWSVNKADRQQRLMDTSKPLRLVCAGRQIKIKATDQILQAMRQAIDSVADLRLDVYGDGDDLEAFKSLAAQLNLNDRVTFHGHVPYGSDFFAKLQACDAMVITNLTAEISRNVMIAMALGLPLIIYRNPGTDKLIEQSNAGILVPQGDVGALAQAFVSAHRDRARLCQIIDNGLRAARTNTLEGCHRRRIDIFRERIIDVNRGQALSESSARCA